MHCVGLLLAFATKKASFTIADVPADLAAKREKLANRAETKDEPARPKTLVKQGRAYLSRRLADPDLKPETNSPIAAWLTVVADPT